MHDRRALDLVARWDYPPVHMKTMLPSGMSSMLLKLYLKDPGTPDADHPRAGNDGMTDDHKDRRELRDDVTDDAGDHEMRGDDLGMCDRHRLWWKWQSWLFRVAVKPILGDKSTLLSAWAW